ncbi:uncharacterized protein LOC134812709 [Bolinopsis microptera]|uniref:uncharacterized protein LOC134812709 n=1 Tax=Bolinopsis microptera TaxID=2820187 RepID=UPI003079CD6F
MAETCHELYKCVVELEQAEKEYGTQLGILSDLFIPHLKKPHKIDGDPNRICVVTTEEMEQMLLTKIKDLCEVSKGLSSKLKERLKAWDEDSSLISDVFLKYPDFWDLYGYFCRNIDSAMRRYDEKMMSHDFAALVSLKQGFTNPPLKDLIMLPVHRMKKYKEFFEVFLEKTVGADFIFSHPDFSNIMECKKQVENLLPPDIDAIVSRNQHEQYQKIEASLGSLANEFTSYMKLLHEEPAAAIPWKKRAFRKSFNRKEPLKDERYDIGGKKYGTTDLTPDILNAMKKQEEKDAMSGMPSPRRNAKKTAPPSENFVGSVSKVKVRWEDEVHTYNLLLFKQCLVFSKTRNRTMKISRIIKLKQLWLSDYKDSVVGFGHVEKEENACLGSWLGSELDPELLHRVIFSFSNKDARMHWYTTIQRHIQAAREKEVLRAGLIKVYFKKSDSQLSVPGDNLWQGMSCQEIQIDPTQTVDNVIEDAVKKCQMKDNSYTLSFIVLQDTKIAIEEQLIWMEMPLVIRAGSRGCYRTPKT